MGLSTNTLGAYAWKYARHNYDHRSKIEYIIYVHKRRGDLFSLYFRSAHNEAAAAMCNWALSMPMNFRTKMSEKNSRASNSRIWLSQAKESVSRLKSVQKQHCVALTIVLVLVLISIYTHASGLDCRIAFWPIACVRVCVPPMSKKESTEIKRFTRIQTMKLVSSTKKRGRNGVTKSKTVLPLISGK